MSDNAQVTAQNPPPKARRGWVATARNIVITMVILIVGVLVYLALFPRVEHTPHRDVPVTPEAQMVAESVGWTVFVPEPRPEGWSATSTGSEGDPMVWRVSYHRGFDDDAEFVRVQQIGHSQAGELRKSLPGQSAGEKDVDGTTWQIYSGSEGPVWAAEKDGTFIVLSGVASDQVFEQFAASLSPVEALSGSTTAPSA